MQAKLLRVLEERKILKPRLVFGHEVNLLNRVWVPYPWPPKDGEPRQEKIKRGLITVKIIVLKVSENVRG